MNPDNQFNNVNPDIRDFSEQVEKFMKNKELREFRSGFVEKITILIISAFGLIAALAWDDALKGLFEYLFNNLTELQEKFAYAGAITVFAVILSVVLSRLILKKD